MQLNFQDYMSNYLMKKFNRITLFLKIIERER